MRDRARRHGVIPHLALREPRERGARRRAHRVVCAFDARERVLATRCVVALVVCGWVVVLNDAPLLLCACVRVCVWARGARGPLVPSLTLARLHGTPHVQCSTQMRPIAAHELALIVA